MNTQVVARFGLKLVETLLKGTLPLLRLALHFPETCREIETVVNLCDLPEDLVD